MEVSSSLLTSNEQSRQDVLFSNISPSPTALEVKESKHITPSTSVQQNPIKSTSSQLQTKKEANTNKIINNPLHQLLDYNGQKYFTDRQTSSRADQNSKRLILEDYKSAETQTDIPMSKDALLKHLVISRQNYEQNYNFIKSVRQEPSNMTNWTFNNVDDNPQHKSLTSDTDIYFIRNASSPTQQNTLHSSFHEDKRRHLKKQGHFEEFVVTEIDNKSGWLNTKKYDEKVTLNTELSQDNGRNTSLGKDPMEVALTESYKQLSNKEKYSTHNTVVSNTSSGKDLKRVPANQSPQKPTTALSDLWNIRFSNKHVQLVETNPHNHNCEQTISDQGHATSCSKHTSEKSDITNKLYHVIKKANNSALNNQLQQITTSVRKNIPGMTTEEMDFQSNVAYKQNAKNKVTKANLFENDVYINTNDKSNLPPAKDKDQPSKRISATSLSGKTRSRRGLSLYPVEFSKTSDSSSRSFQKDNSYLDEGKRRESNNLAKSIIWPHQVIQNMFKRPALQQPRAEEPETDFAMDFLQKQFQRAERLSKAFEWMIRFVKVVGHVDSYLRDRIRNAIHMVARLHDSDYGQGNYRSCD